MSKGVQADVDYGPTDASRSGMVFNFFSALGDVAFAYAGHNVVLEIQATIPSTPEKPSKGPMWKGVIVAYIVVAVCYFPVALVGYWMFGNKVEDNILLSLEKPTWLIIMANMFVVIHVIGSYQVINEVISFHLILCFASLMILSCFNLSFLQIFAMPVFDMIETVLVKKLMFKPTWYLRSIVRITYVGKEFKPLI